MTRTITRILVPVDFGDTSDLALDYAVTLARRFGATLHLLHVVDDSSVSDLRARLVDEAARRLPWVLWRCQGVAVRREVRVGHLADMIRETAAERKCDLIVMGMNGRTGMAHLLLGDVAEVLVREAPCPVLTVRANTADVVAAERPDVDHEFSRELVANAAGGRH